MAYTQRLEDLTVCGFDLDWYSIVIPAGSSARISVRFTHHIGDLILRLYNDHNILSPELEINTQDDDEYLGIAPADEDRYFYLRVSSGNGLTDQNRYRLVIEMNLPGTVCNEDAECADQLSCINALCGGYGSENPETSGLMSTPESDTPPENFNPAGPIQQNPGESQSGPAVSTCLADQYEPNHTLNTAIDIAHMGPGPWSAQICSEDRDLFTFMLNETSDVQLEVLFDPTAGEIDASLLAEDGRMLMFGQIIHGGEFFYAESLEPGRYYLLVQGHVYTIENSYQFNIITTPRRRSE